LLAGDTKKCFAKLNQNIYIKLQKAANFWMTPQKMLHNLAKQETKKAADCSFSLNFFI